MASSMVSVQCSPAHEEASAQFGRIEIADALAWIIQDFTGEKRKDALKGVMNTGF
jgi:hypothetical protein